MTEHIAAAITKGAEALIFIILAGLLGWQAVTILDLRDWKTASAVRIATLEDKARDIVPREENERRWDAVMKQGEQNFLRLNALEQRCGYIGAK